MAAHPPDALLLLLLLLGIVCLGREEEVRRVYTRQRECRVRKAIKKPSSVIMLRREPSSEAERLRPRALVDDASWLAPPPPPPPLSHTLSRCLVPCSSCVPLQYYKALTI